jgi:hypothetical protein
MALASKSIKISQYTRMPTMFLLLFGLRYGNNKVRQIVVLFQVASPLQQQQQQQQQQQARTSDHGRMD